MNQMSSASVWLARVPDPGPSHCQRSDKKVYRFLPIHALDASRVSWMSVFSFTVQRRTHLYTFAAVLTLHDRACSRRS